MQNQNLKEYLELYILPKIQECYKQEVEQSIKRIFEKAELKECIEKLFEED